MKRITLSLLLVAVAGVRADAQAISFYTAADHNSFVDIAVSTPLIVAKPKGLYG